MTTDTQQLTIPALSVVDVPAFQALCFTTNATLPQVAQLGYVPPRLYTDAARLGLTITGPVQYLYEGVSGNETKAFTLTIALPIGEPEPGTLSDGFVFASIPAFRAAAFTYAGAWDTFMPMYDALFAAFYEQGHAYSGNLREVYTLVDLKQPEQCVTEILVGLLG